MKMILRAGQHLCLDVAVLRLYIRIHTSIQQRQKITYLVGCVRTLQYGTIERMYGWASRRHRVWRATQGKTLGNLMAVKD